MKFACLLFRELRAVVDVAVVHGTVSEAVRLEQAFFLTVRIRSSWDDRSLTRGTAALPKPLVGMKSRLMAQYVEYVADFLLGVLGYRALFRTKNPVSC